MTEQRHHPDAGAILREARKLMARGHPGKALVLSLCVLEHALDQLQEALLSLQACLVQGKANPGEEPVQESLPGSSLREARQRRRREFH